MPKIANYTAAHDEHHGPYKWVHDEEDYIRVIVTKDDSEKDDDYWRVRVWNYAHMTELGPLSKNKEEMREVAVEWMRNNPDGWEPNF